MEIDNNKGEQENSIDEKSLNPPRDEVSTLM